MRCPDDEVGTIAVKLVVDAVVICARSEFTSRTFAPTEGSKFVPLTVTLEPMLPIDGLKLEIVGAVAPTANVVGLVVEPAGVVTEIEPFVAPIGTLTTSSVVVADVTVAPVPLNWTVFCEGVVLKPVPWIATVVPTTPASGATSRITSSVASSRVIEVMFPAASYPYAADPAAGSITPDRRPAGSYVYRIGSAPTARTDPGKIGSDELARMRVRSPMNARARAE